MSTLTDQLDALKTERKQASDIIAARAKLQGLYNTVSETDDQIQAIVDTGQFDTIPTELKQQLLAIWQAAQTFRAICEEASNAEVLNWS